MDYLLSKIPRVNKVCGCCDLKTGNRALAWVLISFHILGLLLVWVMISESEDKLENVMKALPDEGREIKEKEGNFEFALTLYALASTWMHIIFSLICYIFVKGIKEQNTFYMLPYMIIYGLPGLVCVLVGVSCILLIPFYFSSFGFIILFLIAFGLIGGIFSSIFIFAYSLYKEIEEDNANKMQGLVGGLNL